mmetsp:Transcript_20415/g.48596  ORF Transcript_20415/g.48596 Transcript_20415/m.48596 type:complete len:200 (-) Transcript_20415:1054-1653(-)
MANYPACCCRINLWPQCSANFLSRSLWEPKSGVESDRHGKYRGRGCHGAFASRVLGPHMPIDDSCQGSVAEGHDIVHAWTLLLRPVDFGHEPRVPQRLHSGEALGGTLGEELLDEVQELWRHSPPLVRVVDNVLVEHLLHNVVRGDAPQGLKPWVASSDKLVEDHPHAPQVSLLAVRSLEHFWGKIKWGTAPKFESVRG